MPPKANRRRYLGLGLIAFAVAPLCAQTPDGTEFFEKEIRPVLATKCYGCHSSKSKSPMGGLVLDTKNGLKKGGNGGPVLVAGDPSASRLLQALTYTQTELRMPPTGKLPDEKVAAFEKWILAGAPDPREDGPATAPATAKKSIDIETGRKWWAFQPVAPLPQPKVRNSALAKRWAREKVDWFIYANLEKNKLRPSPEADRATLIERASLDLTGLRPTYEEVQAFVADRDPAAYEKLIDRLLSSPHYGERWGRYWLDVARYGEDNPTSEATNPPYPFAWRYRDWVIEAINKDVPYDRFVALQLAADLVPGTSRSDLRALGYLGSAPIYHTDLRLSKDVTETLFTDAWDERVDAVSRGLLGLTVACARCHDHKFDPILTKDYYAMAGMFASTTAAPRPLADLDKETDEKFMFATQRLFYLSYMANLMNGEPGSKPEEAAKKSAEFTQEMLNVRDSMAFVKESHPEMWAYLDTLARVPRPKQTAPAAETPGAKPPAAFPAAGRRRPVASDLPFMQSVFDAGTWIDGSDPDLTKVDIRPGVARDMHILPHANVAAPGALAPRQFPTVLSKGDTTFKQGSGRLEFANDIFTQSGPLAARVIVNRVWGWHFGKPLVATESDFGWQGEKPSHPDLLSDLSARFLANGLSLKWLHRRIMLSAAYRQSSHPRADGLAADPTNILVWRMNPRRLDIEAYRDNLLRISGDLEDKIPALSFDLDAPTNHLRTVYGRVSRGRLNTLLALYDFPDPVMTAPKRELTTSPLQQLFVMNSPFMQERAADLVKRVDTAPEMTAKVRGMYRDALNRNPMPKELDAALTYLDKGTLTQFAQALLASNEVIFWP
ncbi:MAG: PSD1 and planctomycete cytochrome C domain-containing protein [Acidobacteriota bacterium]|nr:PSD1 and planctomycete cytochrome C domain-containing protein [Acidobacteriota bacterium]